MKKFFLFFLLASTSVYAQLPTNIPSNGLLAWYPFNGNANDESGFLNHATIGTNITLTSDRNGVPNSAYNFVGLSQLIIPTAPYTPFDSSFCISLWLKSSSFNRMQPININDGNLFTNNLNFALNNSGTNFVFWNSQGSNNIVTGSTGQYTDGFWHHMLFQRKDSIVELYFDGILNGTKLYKTPIGKNTSISLSNGSYSWLGQLDDFAIWNRALTATEIDSLYDLANAKIVISTPLETDAFPVGYPDTIRWNAQFAIKTVKLEYTLDGGNSWLLLEDSLPSSNQKYIWITPNLPGNVCTIRVSDRQDSTIFALSNEFLISKYKWSLVTNAAPFSIRDGSTAITYKDSMYLIGGWNPLDPVNYPLITNNEVWRSFDGANWSLISSGPWEPRHTFGSALYDNKMWILGGDELQNKWQRDVWNSSDGVHWNLINDSVPWGERMTHMSCVYDNKMWIMGGQKIVGWSNVVDTVYNDVWSSTDGINWTKVTANAGWAPRAQIQGQVVFDNKMWIMGGGTYNGIRKFYNDVWNTTDGINWTQVTANAPWPARQYNEITVYDSAMWVIDGYDNNSGNRNDVWYSYDGAKWFHLKGTPWPVRHASSVFTHDESLWLVAGNLWNDVWRLDNGVCKPIALQPTNDTAYTSDTALFTVAIPHPNSSFQWQIDSTGTWSNLNDTLQFLGATSDTLKVQNVWFNNQQQKFRCIVTKRLCSDTSAAASLIVLSGVAVKKDEKKNEGIEIYPNPASEFISVKVGKSQIGQSYKLVDVYGKLLREDKILTENFKLNTSNLSSGLYFLKIGNQIPKRFEIQQF
jgi:hypothetical protein